MKRLLLASVAAIALMPMAAKAADLGTRPTYKAPPPMVAAAPVFAWSGCYLGANIGGAWAHQSFSRFADFEGTLFQGSHTASGIAGGGQLGCDYQFASNWVIGVQGMFDGADLSASHINQNDPDSTFSTKVRWFGTVTGRLGFLVGPSFLIYGKGGVAFANDRHSRVDTDSGGFDIDINSTGDFTRTGWDAGVGLEWMFTPGWSVWVEYDHMGFGTKNESFVIPGDCCSLNEAVKQSIDKVLVGINYRFGLGKGKSPVVARY
jgi:outer membrane immunogenic protein